LLLLNVSQASVGDGLEGRAQCAGDVQLLQDLSSGEMRAFGILSGCFQYHGDGIDDLLQASL
jgi:hypothetical protein